MTDFASSIVQQYLVGLNSENKITRKSKSIDPTASVCIINVYKLGYSASHGESPVSLSPLEAEILIPHDFLFISTIWHDYRKSAISQKPLVF